MNQNDVASQWHRLTIYIRNTSQMKTNYCASCLTTQTVGLFCRKIVTNSAKRSPRSFKYDFCDISWIFKCKAATRLQLMCLRFVFSSCGSSATKSFYGWTKVQPTYFCLLSKTLQKYTISYSILDQWKILTPGCCFLYTFVGKPTLKLKSKRTWPSDYGFSAQSDVYLLFRKSLFFLVMQQVT